eukprot:scaffold80311_cov25-Tisochrysis_lutea.AAC.2
MGAAHLTDGFLPENCSSEAFRFGHPCNLCMPNHADTPETRTHDVHDSARYPGTLSHGHTSSCTCTHTNTHTHTPMHTEQIH